MAQLSRARTSASCGVVRYDGLLPAGIRATSDAAKAGRVISSLPRHRVLEEPEPHRDDRTAWRVDGVHRLRTTRSGHQRADRVHAGAGLPAEPQQADLSGSHQPEPVRPAHTPLRASAPHPATSRAR